MILAAKSGSPKVTIIRRLGGFRRVHHALLSRTAPTEFTVTCDGRERPILRVKWMSDSQGFPKRKY